MITWTTARGTNITLQIIRQVPNLADCTIASPTWLLSLEGDGRELTGMMGATLEQDPAHGLCLVTHRRRNIVPVPAAQATAVTALIAEYADGCANRSARLLARLADGAAYDRDYARTESVRVTGRAS